MIQQKGNTFWTILSLCLYTLVFILYTYPLAGHMDQVYIGKPQTGDASQYIWNTWHFSHCLKQGINPFKTDLLFYPQGASLVMHAYTPVAGLLNLLLDNPALSVNIILLLSFVAGALGMYLLARYLGANGFLSMVAGFIFSYFPYKTSHLIEHFNLELTACIPFYILFYLKAFRFTDGRLLPVIVSRKHFIYLLVTGCLCLLCDYYYTIYLVYFSLLYMAVRRIWPVMRMLSARKWLWILPLVLVVGHIIVRALVISGADDKGALWWSGDIAALFLPPANSVLYGGLDIVKTLTQQVFRYPGSIEFVLFPGFAFWVLVVIYIRVRKSIKMDNTLAVLTVLSLVFLMCCFPEFKVAGKRLFYNISALIYYIPFVNNVRTPPRYELMFMALFLPALMVVLSAVWGKFPWRVIIITASLFLFVEYWPKPYTVIKQSDIPEVYQALKPMPEGAILPIPMGIRDGFEEQGSFNTNQFLYQTVHEKPIVGGYLSRLSKETKTFYARSGTIKDILILQDTVTHADLKQDHPFDLPVRYIVVEPSSVKVFEPYFDRVLSNKHVVKSAVDGYLLYQLY